jgi:hypothetical protein
MELFIFSIKLILPCLLIAMLFFAFISAIQGCNTGHHDWYKGPCSIDPAHFTCGTYGRTGPLPGEESYVDSLGTGLTYRKERHCLTCDHAEYWDRRNNVWKTIRTK